MQIVKKAIVHSFVVLLFYFLAKQKRKRGSAKTSHNPSGRNQYTPADHSVPCHSAAQDSGTTKKKTATTKQPQSARAIKVSYISFFLYNLFSSIIATH